MSKAPVRRHELSSTLAPHSKRRSSLTLDPEPQAPYSSGRNLPPESNPLRAAALDYAKRGWPVLPLRPRDKTPNGLLVPHGLNDATTDVTRIDRWWRRVPDANVGIRTGVGLDVIDLDGEEAGRAFVASTRKALTPDLLVRTARGWHLWFASSGLPTRAGVIEGVDVRGSGGYVVAPPSVHPSGEKYRLVDPATGQILDRLPSSPLAPAPAWLASWCRPEPARTLIETSPIRLNADHYVRAAIEGECAAVAATPEGSRNHRLNRAAFSLGTLVGARLLDAEEARADLFAAAMRAGLSEVEARRTIASGLDAGQRQPRRTVSSLGRGDRARSGDRSRPEDPWMRPVEPATAAVLSRARGASASTRAVPAPVRPAAERGIGR
jgi:hypothetical protein